MSENPTFMGIEVDFPHHNPYPAQRAIMAKAMRCFLTQENALLESPTGTGKTLALLASSLAYQDHVKAHEDQNNNSEEPKCAVWYTSRTHLQLQQLTSELKKLRYMPKMAILASRKQTCLNQQVLKTGDVDNACRAVHQKMHNCIYGRNANNMKHSPVEFLPGGEYGKYDLEDLKEYCREKMLCPFIIGRNLTKNADLVLAPYSYVISSNIRNQMKIDLTGSILIIDEAHNVESTCRESSSLSITKQNITSAITLTQMSQQEKILFPNFVEGFEALNGIFCAIGDYLDKRRMDFDNYGKSDTDYIEEKDTKETLEKLHLSINSWPLVKNYIKIILKADQDNTNPNENDRFPNEFLVTILENVSICFELLFANNGANFEHYRIVYVHNEEDFGKDQLRIICMFPGVAFSPLANSVHSLILTSGTLSPLEIFATELGAKFPRENCLSAPHVIDPSQVQCYIISVSSSGQQLNSTYSAMKNNPDSTYKSLGDVLITLLPFIPDGVLFFLSSHSILMGMISSWKKTGIYKTINGMKPIFIESQKKDFNKVYNDFKRSIDSNKGGLFLGVCRGKISEGMDFYDRQARAVFAFGIPYPSLKDVDVTLKRKYNDKHPNGYSGKEWYEVQAYRGLFQSIGRCIRHCKDYGAIFLLDQRFTGIIDKLPLWIHKSILTNRSYPDIQRNLSSFYADMSVKFPLKAIEEIRPNASVTLTCTCCAFRLIIDAKLTLNSLGKIEVGVLAKTGIQKIFNTKNDVYVCYIKPNCYSKLSFVEEPPEYFQSDSIAYQKLSCPQCSTLIGVRIHAASKKNAEDLDSLWLLLSTLCANQAGISKPLDAIVEKPKVLSNEFLQGIK